MFTFKRVNVIIRVKKKKKRTEAAIETNESVIPKRIEPVSSKILIYEVMVSNKQ